MTVELEVLAADLVMELHRVSSDHMLSPTGTKYPWRVCPHPLCSRAARLLDEKERIGG